MQFHFCQANARETSDYGPHMMPVSTQGTHENTCHYGSLAFPSMAWTYMSRYGNNINSVSDQYYMQIEVLGTIAQLSWPSSISEAAVLCSQHVLLGVCCQLHISHSERHQEWQHTLDVIEPLAMQVNCSLLAALHVADTCHILADRGLHNASQAEDDEIATANITHILRPCPVLDGQCWPHLC